MTTIQTGSEAFRRQTGGAFHGGMALGQSFPFK